MQQVSAGTMYHSDCGTATCVASAAEMHHRASIAPTFMCGSRRMRSLEGSVSRRLSSCGDV